MSLFSRLLRWSVGHTRPPARPLQPVQRRQDAQAVQAREKRLAVRLLEDEALRGELTDDAWMPVQSWLLERVRHLAATTAGLDDSAARRVLDDAETELRDEAIRRVSALSARSVVSE